MAAAKELKNGDRVRRVGTTGKATATVIETHLTKGGNALTLLPDDRPRSKGALVVTYTDYERVGVRANRCPRCQQQHSIFDCPEGA